MLTQEQMNQKVEELHQMLMDIGSKPEEDPDDIEEAHEMGFLALQSGTFWKQWKAVVLMSQLGIPSSQSLIAGISVAFSLGWHLRAELEEELSKTSAEVAELKRLADLKPSEGE